jgi:hypothetical protein
MTMEMAIWLWIIAAPAVAFSLGATFRSLFSRAQHDISLVAFASPTGSPIVEHQVSALERAFQLARSGWVAKVDDIQSS